VSSFPPEQRRDAAVAVEKVRLFGMIADTQKKLDRFEEEEGFEAAFAVACLAGALTEDESERLRRAADTDKGAVLTEMLGDEARTEAMLRERFRAQAAGLREALTERAHLTREEASAFVTGIEGSAGLGARCIWACLGDGRL
jgi:hypothetical protein